MSLHILLPAQVVFDVRSLPQYTSYFLLYLLLTSIFLLKSPNTPRTQVTIALSLVLLSGLPLLQEC